MEDFLASAGHPADTELLAHAEGELVGAGARAMELHLAGCAACRAAVEAQAAMRLVLRTAPPADGVVAVPDVRALLAGRGLLADGAPGAAAAPAAPAPAPLRAAARPAHGARLAELWRRRPVLVLAPAAGLAAAAAVLVVVLAGGGGGGVMPAADPTALTAAAPAPAADASRGASTETQAYGTGPAASGPAESGPAAGAAAKAAPLPAAPSAAAAAAAAAPADDALVRAVAGTAAEVVALLQQAGVAAEAADDGTVQVAAADRERAVTALAPLAEGSVRVSVRG